MQSEHNAPDAPIRIDFDRDVLRTNLTIEALGQLARSNPISLARLLPGIAWGSPQARSELLRQGDFELDTLPCDTDVLEDLLRHSAAGGQVELLTSIDAVIVRRIAKHHGLEAVRIIDRSDRHATAVPAIERPASTPTLRETVAPYLLALRPHQWTKNLLVAVPLVAGHKIGDPAAVQHVLVTFLAFSLCASAVYLLNDILDAPADRRHPTKRNRPIAAGTVDLNIIVATIPVLLMVAFGLAALLSSALAGMLAVYLAATTAYSTMLKRKMLWDVFTLAGLYTIRIFAGAIAIEKHLSFWLLAFSAFAFLSLALVKRFVELSTQTDSPKSPEETIAQRGYRLGDVETLHQIGIASCFSSVLVFALYIKSDAVVELYATPEILWLACPLLLHLLLRFWLLARRGEMHEDPVVFALRDWRSQAELAAIAAVMAGAALWS